MRFQYRHPKLYDFLIRFLYTRKLLEEFREEVGRQQEVFEVAAGYGRMAGIIDSSNRYYGIDLNEIFVRYGRAKGIHLELKDIFDPEAYRQSDVFVVVDILHRRFGSQHGKNFQMKYQKLGGHYLVTFIASV